MSANSMGTRLMGKCPPDPSQEAFDYYGVDCLDEPGDRP